MEIEKFILAGKSVFTLENVETGNRFTYKVVKKDFDGKICHFVNLLSGPDNISDYKYLGTIFDEDKLVRTRKSTVGEDATSYKAFNWLWNMVKDEKTFPNQVLVYHEGRCGRCGRRLTVPESIESGFGPECINKIV